MDSGPNPLEPLSRLEELFTEVAEAQGARVVQFLTSPKRREVIVFMDLDEDLFLTESEKTTKDAFEDIMNNFSVVESPEQEDKEPEVVSGLEELARKLEDPNDGIL